MASLNFASTLWCRNRRISVNNTAVDGTGTLQPLLSNAAASGFVYGYKVLAVTTTLASSIRFWRTNSDGTFLLMPAVPITANTVNSTSPNFSAEIGLAEESMLVIPIIAGDTISATMALDSGSQTVDVMIWGAFQ
jgi:hypothetical protein